MKTFFGHLHCGNVFFIPDAKMSESQWVDLAEIAQKLEAEYALRRTMLITRLNATLQSFAWSEKMVMQYFFFLFCLQLHSQSFELF